MVGVRWVAWVNNRRETNFHGREKVREVNSDWVVRERLRWSQQAAIINAVPDQLTFGRRDVRKPVVWIGNDFD